MAGRYHGDASVLQHEDSERPKGLRRFIEGDDKSGIQVVSLIGGSENRFISVAMTGRGKSR